LLKKNKFPFKKVLYELQQKKELNPKEVYDLSLLPKFEKFVWKQNLNDPVSDDYVVKPVRLSKIKKKLKTSESQGSYVGRFKRDELSKKVIFSGFN
jgi:hypothetical protein